MKKISPTKRNIEGVPFELGDLYPKQRLFCTARQRYIGYGGARGGGKSYTVRWKAKAGCLQYPGIRILIVRKTYPDLENSIIMPLVGSLQPEVAGYNATMHLITFFNGSTIKFGHYSSAEDALEYQGQEYDWIFIDEATQLTEQQFRTLGACLRGVTRIPRRMYLTANPGGVGHLWFKRLFIERHYYLEKGENPEDYYFIPATVDDNPKLLESSPDYINMLDLLPEDIRRAHRYGDWDALGGLFFPEFREETHVEEPFIHVPEEWTKIRSFDYGLDMFACLWAAIDFEGRIHIYREVQQSGLIVSAAAELMHSLTPERERIAYTIAPPDMWARQKDTGRSMAELFMQHGVGLVKASNNRIQGWMAVKEALKPMGPSAGAQRSGSGGERRSTGRSELSPKGGSERYGGCDDEKPGLLVSRECRGLIRNIQAIQHDDKNVSDCAAEPHDITHIVDACRYLCITRSITPERPSPSFEEEDALEPYDKAMTGGEASASYMSYGA
ncbi:phage terminase large subunit [Oscillibacter sp. MSJ-2]|uniref:Phage terminase large subunit n=1 Tax=Dysosmobacter acutus TaxID=2841504 RepID=A0ABS6F8D4_9FIRM|nr:phage terminase large subunit [Dysosmobacter acutus]MBU5626543.1 phage terminase large subunit [Dysosmobacter acutus]